MNIKIREAKKEDADKIQKLYYVTWLNTYVNEESEITKDKLEKRFSNLLSEKSIEWLKNFIESGIPKNHKYLFAEHDNNIVGVMYVEREVDHNRIQGLYILPEYQGKGLGTSFWNEAYKIINKENNTVLDVVEYNKKAIEFYKKFGFIDSGKRFLEEVSNIDYIKRPMMEMILKREK